MNYVSILRVAERVYKSGLNVDEINFYDMIEWVGDAIAKIGVSYAYMDRVTNGESDQEDPITIADFRGTLPTDLVYITGVRDTTTHSSLVEEVGSFRVTYNNSNLVNDGDPVMLAYRIENGYIYTNFEEGEVEISYMAYKTDTNGWPMIPDDERYITACVAYVMYMIGYRLFLQDRLDERKFLYLEKEWLFYVNSAKTKAHMPTLDKMEALKNQLGKMRQSPFHHAAQFKYLSVPEVLRVL